jgi:NADH:ubiquinone oxidoreductase subunit C
MDVTETVNAAARLLQPFQVGAGSRIQNRLDVVVKPEDLPAATRALCDARWGYLSAITGLDLPWPKTPVKPGAATAPAEASGPLEDRLEALYQFVSGPVVVTLRVSVPYHDPRIPSICPAIPSATLYERELQDMFGFVIDGTPDRGRLLLSDDWPDGVFPLRKAFTGLDTATKT